MIGENNFQFDKSIWVRESEWVLRDELVPYQNVIGENNKARAVPIDIVDVTY